MTREHAILRLANRFAPTEPVQPPGWRYRRDIGAWVNASYPDTLMIEYTQGNTRPEPQPPRPKPQPPPSEPPLPMSKKGDIETGEDMKGA